VRVEAPLAMAGSSAAKRSRGKMKGNRSQNTQSQTMKKKNDKLGIKKNK
jgi:hypothetical protein